MKLLSACACGGSGDGVGWAGVVRAWGVRICLFWLCCFACFGVGLSACETLYVCDCVFTLVYECLCVCSCVSICKAAELSPAPNKIVYKEKLMTHNPPFLTRCHCDGL